MKFLVFFVVFAGVLALWFRGFTLTERAEMIQASKPYLIYVLVAALVTLCVILLATNGTQLRVL